MTPERWATIEKLYHEALAQDTADRGRFLADACAGDEALRRDVRSLLEHDGSAAFLSTPAVVQVGHVIPTDSSLIGKAIGPYAISARIGAGGMGEVYRARDQKLGRDVAIKILSKDFTSDPERLARFAREARVLATLNHPHIGAIYSVEEADGVRGLVLELVEGETLAERIARATGLDLGGVEVVIDDRDGVPRFYDINAMSNFVADPLNVLGWDPHDRLIDYLETLISEKVAA